MDGMRRQMTDLVPNGLSVFCWQYVASNGGSRSEWVVRILLTVCGVKWRISFRMSCPYFVDCMWRQMADLVPNELYVFCWLYVASNGGSRSEWVVRILLTVCGVKWRISFRMSCPYFVDCMWRQMADLVPNELYVFCWLYVASNDGSRSEWVVRILLTVCGLKWRISFRMSCTYFVDCMWRQMADLVPNELYVFCWLYVASNDGSRSEWVVRILLTV